MPYCELEDCNDYTDRAIVDKNTGETKNACDLHIRRIKAELEAKGMKFSDYYGIKPL